MAHKAVVAQIFHRLDPGGAELRTIDLAARLKPDIRTVFIVLSGTPGSLEHVVRAQGFEIIHIRLGFGFYSALKHVVRTRGVTTLHSHASTTSGLFCLMGAACGVPQRIAHFRSDSDGKRNTASRRIQRWFMRTLIRIFATDVVGVSPMALRYAGRWATRSSRGWVVPSGIEIKPLAPPSRLAQMRRELGLGSAHLVIVHVGRDLPEKNRPRAISITATASAHGIDTALLLVGRLAEGEERTLRDLANRLGVADSLRVVGERDDVQDLLAMSDVCLVTSTREGLPGVVLEAVAAETPCVASDLPGVCWLAETFTTVSPIGLQESDERWIEALQTSTVRFRSETHSSDRTRLIESQFSIGSAIENYRRLWLGGEK